MTRKNSSSSLLLSSDRINKRNQAQQQNTNDSVYEGDGFTILTEADQLSQRSFISYQSNKNNTIGNNSLNSSIVSSASHHKTIQKINSILMKSLLEKLIKKLSKSHQSLAEEAKYIQKTCYHYLLTQHVDETGRDLQSKSKIGFFALIQSLSSSSSGLYQY